MTGEGFFLKAKKKSIWNWAWKNWGVSTYGGRNLFKTDTVGRVFKKLWTWGLKIRRCLIALFINRHFAAKFCSGVDRNYGHCDFNSWLHFKQRS
jgi:hypothetical protein